MAIRFSNNDEKKVLSQADKKQLAQKLTEQLESRRIPVDPTQRTKLGLAIEDGLKERKKTKHQVETHDKEKISLWVDKKTLAYFRATGPGWQGRMNDVLVAFMLSVAK